MLRILIGILYIQGLVACATEAALVTVAFTPVEYAEPTISGSCYPDNSIDAVCSMYKTDYEGYKLSCVTKSGHTFVTTAPGGEV